VGFLSLLLSIRLLTAMCRMVVRIMVMVPIYAVASLISLFSVEAAFYIDAIRDIYEVCTVLAHRLYSHCQYSLVLFSISENTIAMTD
jgi:hypothetical protein